MKKINNIIKLPFNKTEKSGIEKVVENAVKRATNRLKKSGKVEDSPALKRLNDKFKGLK
jgi:hypothetical protein